MLTRAAAMEIGDLVTYDGILCYLRGIQPMGVLDRLADVELVETGELLSVPLGDLAPAPEPGSRTGGSPTA